jgi:hypothetical protein
MGRTSVLPCRKLWMLAINAQQNVPRAKTSTPANLYTSTCTKSRTPALPIPCTAKPHTYVHAYLLHTHKYTSTHAESWTPVLPTLCFPLPYAANPRSVDPAPPLMRSYQASCAWAGGVKQVLLKRALLLGGTQPHRLLSGS